MRASTHTVRVSHLPHAAEPPLTQPFAHEPSSRRGPQHVVRPGSAASRRRQPECIPRGSQPCGASWERVRPHCKLDHELMEQLAVVLRCIVPLICVVSWVSSIHLAISNFSGHLGLHQTAHSLHVHGCVGTVRRFLLAAGFLQTYWQTFVHMDTCTGTVFILGSSYLRPRPFDGTAKSLLCGPHGFNIDPIPVFIRSVCVVARGTLGIPG